MINGLRRTILAALALSAAWAAGCDTDPLFMDCPLSNSIKEACADQSETTTYTCVVAEHPYCQENICASWQGSTARCTKACTPGDASTCPADAECKSYLDYDFCVLKSDIKEE